MAAQPHDLLGRDAALLIRVVGVRADRAEDVVVRLGDGEQDGKLPDARRDGHHDSHARSLGTREKALAVLGELRKIEVAVMVDQHADLLYGLLCCGFCLGFGAGFSGGGSASGAM